MGVGSLDLLVNLLGSTSAIVHYLWRRKSFEATANYVADELDLIAYYLKTGFNIGEQESDGTFLMIYGYPRVVSGCPAVGRAATGGLALCADPSGINPPCRSC